MKIIKTILMGCAWCKKIIGVESCDTDKEDDFISVSHGICMDCEDKVLQDIEGEEE